MSFSIIVLPFAQIMISNLSLNEGDRLEGNCIGTGNPAPMVAWVRNGVILEPSLNSSYSLNSSDVQMLVLPDGAGVAYFVSLTLAIPMVTDTDAGTYECLAVNVAGNDTADISVTVNCE